MNANITANNVKIELRKYANQKKASFLKRYFKTEPGEYAEGDTFLGLTVPLTRNVAKIFRNLELKEVQKLLESKIHEERQVALMILSLKTKNANPLEFENINNFYLNNLKHVNNWDLVDGSAENLLGKFLSNNQTYSFTFKGESLKGIKILERLARSENIWERRIGIIATFEFIKNNKFDKTLKISRILLGDKHDLIHKAVGWMLREVGKRDQKLLEEFLRKNYLQIPRTTLRYAIEKFDQDKRRQYLAGLL